MVQDKRRRRKKLRVEEQYSSESDSDSSVESESVAAGQQEDVDMDSESDGSEPDEQYPENARVLAHKSAAPEGDFNQNFLTLVTSEFGDDLENLRKAPDFGNGSLELLIAGLKQGVNIFDPEQKRLLLSKNN